MEAREAELLMTQHQKCVPEHVLSKYKCGAKGKLSAPVGRLDRMFQREEHPNLRISLALTLRGFVLGVASPATFKSKGLLDSERRALERSDSIPVQRPVESVNHTVLHWEGLLRSHIASQLSGKLPSHSATR
jgi:hypothetical protein